MDMPRGRALIPNLAVLLVAAAAVATTWVVTHERRVPAPPAQLAPNVPFAALERAVVKAPPLQSSDTRVIGGPGACTPGAGGRC